jgi:rod shape-determining protein MreD
VKLTSVVAAVAVGLLLQMVLARFAIGGTWAFDLVLVAVVFVGLQWGPTAGLVAGTIGGLGQDLLSGGIVGISGLAKTPVGLFAGIIGTQFVLIRASGRAIVVAVATAVHRILMMGVIALVEQHWPSITWGAMLTEIALNTAAGYIAFQIVGAVPGVIERQRLSRRASFGRRQW